MTAPEISPSTVTYTCGGCPVRWPGVSRAHCSACHRTFGGTGLFDQHRRAGKCVNPATLGMFLVGGIWQTSEQPRGFPKRST